MDPGLQGKVAFVAASSQGIDFATAMELAKEGVNVALCARTESDYFSNETLLLYPESGNADTLSKYVPFAAISGYVSVKTTSHSVDQSSFHIAESSPDSPSRSSGQISCIPFDEQIRNGKDGMDRPITGKVTVRVRLSTFEQMRSCGENVPRSSPSNTALLKQRRCHN